MNNKLYNLFETESQYFNHSNKSSYKFNHMNIAVVFAIQFIQSYILTLFVLDAADSEDLDGCCIR